jgi:adenylate cyclase
MPRVFKAILLGVLIGILGLALSFFRFARDMEENAGLGLLFKLRGVKKAPSDVVVISIDKESSEKLDVSDNPDKWPRSLHARLTETLARAGAGVITFDVHFIEPRSAEDNALFAESIKKAGNVVLAEPLTAREVASPGNGGSQTGVHSIVRIVKPIAPLAEAAVATAPFVLPRIPFKVNQYWTFQTGAGDSPTFPTVAFQLYASPVYGEFIRLLAKAAPNRTGKLPRDLNTGIETRGIVRLMKDIREVFESDPVIADKLVKELDASDYLSGDLKRYRLLKTLVKTYGGSDSRYVNYYGPPRTVTTIPYYNALQLGQSASTHRAIDLKGKAVFVGLSEVLLAERKDSFYTVFSQANGIFISGVEIAATAFANILEDTAVTPISLRYYVVAILLWGIAVGVICRLVHVVAAAGSVICLSIVYLVAAAYQFKTDGGWYPIVIPLFLQAPGGFFGAVLWNYFETNKERQNVRKALGYYVPDEVVDQLARNIVDIKGSGHTVYGACLFTDAAGYTTLSEKMDPRQLSDFMHKYFEATFAPVKRHGGLVVNLKGDSILAIWKAARPEAGLRKQACLAALSVAAAVQEFNRSFENLDLPTRVGVHCGQIFLGNIGAGDHYEYGPTGDTVNTASRMDGLNKFLGTEILVSDDVIQELDGFLTREVGKFRLKGKAQPVVVHELLCRMEESEEGQKKACAMFAEALGAFRNQSWDEAIEKFCRVIEKSEKDGPSHFYLNLCEQYKKMPVEGPWDGVIPVEEK